MQPDVLLLGRERHRSLPGARGVTARHCASARGALPPPASFAAAGALPPTIVRVGHDYRCTARFCGAEPHVQRLEAAQPEIFAPFEASAAQREVRQTPQQRGKGDLPFHAGERRAEAEMRRPAESEVAIVLAREIEPVGIGEALRDRGCPRPSPPSRRRAS